MLKFYVTEKLVDYKLGSEADDSQRHVFLLSAGLQLSSAESILKAQYMISIIFSFKKLLQLPQGHYSSKYRSRAGLYNKSLLKCSVQLKKMKKTPPPCICKSLDIILERCLPYPCHAIQES